MRVKPGASELLGFSALIHLVVEEVRHGVIIKGHADAGDRLLDCLEVLDVQQVLRSCDAEAANLRLAVVAEEEELGPGCR
jgi:hypothetical protein